nr:GNAT family N-acetyltransferase [Pseudaestuariivita rosea]
MLKSPGVHLIGDLACFLVVRVLVGEAEVLTLATHPDLRRKGLAGDRLDQLETLARSQDTDTIFLEVAATNEPALTLYHNHGFCESGRRTHYYRSPNGDRIDAILLHKRLT